MEIYTEIKIKMTSGQVNNIERDIQSLVRYAAEVNEKEKLAGSSVFIQPKERILQVTDYVQTLVDAAFKAGLECRKDQ